MAASPPSQAPHISISLPAHLPGSLSLTTPLHATCPLVNKSFEQLLAVQETAPLPYLFALLEKNTPSSFTPCDGEVTLLSLIGGSPPPLITLARRIHFFLIELLAGDTISLYIGAYPYIGAPPRSLTSSSASELPYILSQIHAFSRDSSQENAATLAQTFCHLKEDTLTKEEIRASYAHFHHLYNTYATRPPSSEEGESRSAIVWRGLVNSLPSSKVTPS